MSTKVNVNVSELVIITEVKFIKKFLHAVCEHFQVSDDPYFKCFILRSVVLTKFRKSVGPCPAFYKYNGDVVITLYNASSKTIA